MRTYVSVIIPVFNDPGGIRATLQSLLQIEYPEDSHEIVVVDNGSTDETKQTAEEIAASHDHVSIVVEDDIQSSYAARNRGIEIAVGEILVFIDADMEVEGTWLTELTEFFDETEVDYVGYDVEVKLSNSQLTLVGLYSQAIEFPVELYVNRMNFAPTCSMAVRSDVVENVGAFNEILVSSGDAEFGHRVAAAGYEQRFVSDITVYHPARTKLREHIQKSRRLGRGREQRYNMSNDLRPWYHPKNVLPPDPIRFKYRVGNTQVYSIYLLLIFFLLDYFFKLFKLIGRLEERVGIPK